MRLRAYQTRFMFCGHWVASRPYGSLRRALKVAQQFKRVMDRAFETDTSVSVCSVVVSATKDYHAFGHVVRGGEWDAVEHRYRR